MQNPTLFYLFWYTTMPKVMPEVDCIQPFLKSWTALPIGLFVPIEDTKITCTSLLKVRNFKEVSLCEVTEPIEGISFKDVVGTQDYFLGEIITINKRKFQVIPALKVLILTPNVGIKVPIVKDTQAIRDDGFLKVYVTKNRRLLITTT